MRNKAQLQGSRPLLFLEGTRGDLYDADTTENGKQNGREVEHYCLKINPNVNGHRHTPSPVGAMKNAVVRELWAHCSVFFMITTDLIPCDVQRIAHELWDYAELGDKRNLTADDVKTPVNKLVNGQSTYFELLWEQLSPRQRAPLQALALKNFNIFTISSPMPILDLTVL